MLPPQVVFTRCATRMADAAGGTITNLGTVNTLLVNNGRVVLGGAVSNHYLQTAGTTTVSIRVAIAPPWMTPAGWLSSGRNGRRMRA